MQLWSGEACRSAATDAARPRQFPRRRGLRHRQSREEYVWVCRCGGRYRRRGRRFVIVNDDGTETPYLVWRHFEDGFRIFQRGRTLTRRFDVIIEEDQWHSSRSFLERAKRRRISQHPRPPSRRVAPVGNDHTTCLGERGRPGLLRLRRMGWRVEAVPSHYRTVGLSSGIEMGRYDRARQPEEFACLLTGYMAELLRTRYPQLAEQVRCAPHLCEFRRSARSAYP